MMRKSYPLMKVLKIVLSVNRVSFENTYTMVNQQLRKQFNDYQLWWLLEVQENFEMR